MTEAIGFDEMIKKARAERGASVEQVPPEQNFKGKEAIGFEEKIQRDREERSPKHATLEAEIAVVPENEISKTIEQATILLSLPDHAKFDELYAEANMTNIVLSKLENNRLTISTPGHNLSIEVRTILELIAQKMNTPIHLHPEQHLKNQPPFISNIKQVTDFYISEMLCKFQKIFRLNDQRIQQMCQEYWLSMSYPILVRLAYTEWENRQMDWKVGIKVKDIAAEFTAKNREIKAEYDKMLDDKTTVMKTRMNRMEMESREYKTKINFMNDRINYLKQEEANRVGEVEDSYNKLKDEKTRTIQLEREVIQLKEDNKKLKEQLKEEDSDRWKLDITATPEMPVYRNKGLGQTLTFPVSIEQFKKDYKLTSQDGNTCKYKADDGKEFELPDSIADELMENGTNITSESKKKEVEAAKLYKNNPKWDEIRKFIESVGGEASTSEIAIGIKANVSNIRKQYLKEMEDKGLLAGEQVGKEKRYTLSF
ncbi:MAG: hypothetical protein PHW62_01645 [Candidatus Ratteibacteria bacterium]|nr:hypothetical protein [Candidatus Ratteibacteria bacterium]